MNKIATLLIFGLLAAFAVSCGNNQVAQNPKLETSPAPLSDTSNPYLDASGNAINHNWLQDSSLITTATPAGPYALYLSDLEPDPGFFISNGWGPYERDTSNGEDKAGDGRPMMLNGVGYGKGLGMHAQGVMRYDLQSLGCTAFKSDVGLDDEVDGRPFYSKPRVSVGAYNKRTSDRAGPSDRVGVEALDLTDQSSAIRLGLNISGKRWLELQAGTAQILSPVEEPRINYNIHEDFADARVICQQYPNANTRAFTTYLSDVQPYFANNGWGPYERDTSNGEQQAGDGKTIALNGKRYAKGLGVHSISDLQFDLTGKGCTRFQADVGIDQEIRSSLPSNNPGAAPNVIFAVTDYASGKVLTATYTGLNVSSPVVSLDVNVTGVNKLQLAMSTTKPKSARDWAWFTHADWANARVTCKQPLPIIP